MSVSFKTSRKYCRKAPRRGEQSARGYFISGVWGCLSGVAPQTISSFPLDRGRAADPAELVQLELGEQWPQSPLFQVWWWLMGWAGDPASEAQVKSNRGRTNNWRLVSEASIGSSRTVAAWGHCFWICDMPVSICWGTYWQPLWVGFCLMSRVQVKFAFRR